MTQKLNRKLPAAVTAALNEVSEKLTHRPELRRMFLQCYPNTLETTVEMLDDDTTFVITGDIPAMWLRDSSAQLRPFVQLAKEDEELRSIISGVVRRQVAYILLDPYANAFNKEANGNGHKDETHSHPTVWERKYEIDSLCYPIQLAYLYWKATADSSVFDSAFRDAAYEIIRVWKIEQRHAEESDYSFIRKNPYVSFDTIPAGGKGRPVNDTGMTWSGFRPSDDACTFNYLIPSNMFAVVVLGYLEEIAKVIYSDERLAELSMTLGTEIKDAIELYGVVHHPEFGKIYAYETDGFGNHLLMDDANVPSLLSASYLGYVSSDHPVYRNTRKFLLSKGNPSYYEGEYAKGIGSPHTPEGYVWPIALVMQGLTSTDDEEIKRLVHMLETTTANTGFMHEGFHVDDPSQFTRPWFAWANTLFGEWIYSLVREGHPAVTE
ncbi:glycosyl hydrolase [Paenibacillus swuensis]|uniref:Glycosyl hydrolase n=1 Tax=Paenibacillus swuensis TaxID=1178515 RepID=A0A172TDX4_9BACL|nr:glycoside hydrolase family 125 protein [Paenibacillus swuensis]ANE45239.1 glycosyl hydrolase [Paenibacillus swuensis]